jgi:hypothetical protein
MNMVVVGTSSGVVSSTAQAAVGPGHIILLAATYGKTSTGATANKVIIPSAVTRQVMADTEAGRNVVSCSGMEDLFEKLDS